PERLYQLWEMDRSQPCAPVECIQRLDDDSFSLALRLPDEKEIPEAWRRQVVVLLNGFYAKLEKDFEENGCIAVCIQRSAGTAASWEQLRGQFAGKTNPFQAPAHTVRGDAARGLLPVEKVAILA